MIEQIHRLAESRLILQKDAYCKSPLETVFPFPAKAGVMGVSTGKAVASPV